MPHAHLADLHLIVSCRNSPRLCLVGRQVPRHSPCSLATAQDTPEPEPEPEEFSGGAAGLPAAHGMVVGWTESSPVFLDFCSATQTACLY